MIDEKRLIDFVTAKSIREHRDVYLYKDDKDYFISANEMIDDFDDYILVHHATVDAHTKEDIQKYLEDIVDYKLIKENDKVIVQDNVEVVLKVTDRQIITESGKKFRRSDGILWNDSTEEIKITKRLV